MRYVTAHQWLLAICCFYGVLLCSEVFAADEWQTTTVPDQCSFEMPEKALMQTGTVNRPDGKVEISAYGVDQGPSAYSTLISKLPATSKWLDAESTDDKMKAEQETSVQRVQGKLIETRRISINGYPGRQVTVQLPEKAFIIERLYLVGKTMYKLVVVNVARSDADRYFASFKLLKGADGSPIVPVKWQTFTIPDKCSVELPGDPKPVTKHQGLPEGQAPAIAYSVDTANDTGFLIIGVWDIPGGKADLDEEQVEKQLKVMHEGPVANLKAKLLKVEKVSLDGFPGTDALLRFPDGRIHRQRTYLVHKTLYQCVAVASNAIDTEHFFNSFKLLETLGPTEK